MSYELNKPEKVALHILGVAGYDGLSPLLVELVFGKEFLTYFSTLVKKDLVNFEERQINGLKIRIYVINDEGRKTLRN